MQTIPDAEGSAAARTSLSQASSAREHPMQTSAFNAAKREGGNRTPKPEKAAMFYHDIMSSLHGKDATFEPPRMALGLEVNLQEEVAPWKCARAHLADWCDRLDMSLSNGTPASGKDAVNETAWYKRLDNLEATMNGSLKELNTQLQTVWHAHDVLARKFEVVKQAQNNHAIRLIDLDHATKELDSIMAAVSLNIDACRSQTSLEEHLVAIYVQNALLEESIGTLGSNKRSSANPSSWATSDGEEAGTVIENKDTTLLLAPKAITAVNARLAAVEREHAFLPSAADEGPAALRKEYMPLPLERLTDVEKKGAWLASESQAFTAVHAKLKAIEKEFDLLPCHRTISTVETEPVQSERPSQASPCSVDSEDFSEGVESIGAVSIAASQRQ